MNEVNCDVAVLDVNLRGETVAPVAELLRQRGRPFVLLSGYDRSDLKTSFSDVPVLPKPFDAGELIAVLHQMVERPTIA
jgi:CheY-like chemotaxis protein